MPEPALASAFSSESSSAKSRRHPSPARRASDPRRSRECDAAVELGCCPTEGVGAATKSTENNSGTNRKAVRVMLAPVAASGDHFSRGPNRIPNHVEGSSGVAVRSPNRATRMVRLWTKLQKERLTVQRVHSRVIIHALPCKAIRTRYASVQYFCPASACSERINVEGLPR